MYACVCSLGFSVFPSKAKLVLLNGQSSGRFQTETIFCLWTHVWWIFHGSVLHELACGIIAIKIYPVIFSLWMFVKGKMNVVLLVIRDFIIQYFHFMYEHEYSTYFFYSSDETKCVVSYFRVATITHSRIHYTYIWKKIFCAWNRHYFKEVNKVVSLPFFSKIL